MNYFKFYSQEDLRSLTQTRRFETRMGERVKSISLKEDWMQGLRNCPSKYVLLGVPEDIGIRANYGISGADTAWLPFLSCFLNNQSNDFLTGEDVLVLGHFDFGDLKYLIEKNANSEAEMVEAYRHAVNIIDDAVENMIKVITGLNKIPIVIGGGHNNAYPIIKGAAKGLFKREAIPLAQINCINLDAKPDCSPADGRHSGNGFHYAEADGYLGKYSIIGVHENAVPQMVLLEVHNNPFIDYISFEEIFIHQRKTFLQAVAHASHFTEDNFTGIELDISAVEQALSNEMNPCGVSALQARQYISHTAQASKCAYLHICEAATQLSDGTKNATTGKLINYLVSDFLKALSPD